MINNKKLFKTAAALTIALSLLAGCSNGDGKEAGNADASPNVTASATPEATDNAGNEDTSSSPEPSDEAELQASEKPTDEDAAKESAAPSATTKPSADAAATAKPTPKPTAKPTVKPSEKPSTKPTEKPSTTVPSQKPSPKPTVKPTEKPSQKPEVSDKVKTSDIIDKILEDIELPVLMSVSGEQVKDSYYFDPSELVAEGSYHQAMMNTKATELVVVKLKSDKHYEAVKEGLTKRAEDIIKTFSQYLPDQHEDAKNYQIVRQGNYVMLSISHDQAGIKKVFESFFK
ncbi:DUF4358 domain-containing protein [Paenibacillus sp. NPDC057967]|uniref:DUF4358 domain-containing protein n=1 Tax=Paenibacillus sp. NPDC057967 TaxID=3346293 RepID=UPI0036D95EA3